jgi:hypothetical protein
MPGRKKEETLEIQRLGKVFFLRTPNSLPSIRNSDKEVANRLLVEAAHRQNPSLILKGKKNRNLASQLWERNGFVFRKNRPHA